MTHKILLSLFLLTLNFSVSAHPDHFHVTYGKYTHIQTDGPVVYKVLGNNSWRVEASPNQDGVFVWSKRNSIPSNIKLYTANYSYSVDLSPSKTEHNEFIQPTGRLLAHRSDKDVIVPADIDLLKQKAELMIRAKSENDDTLISTPEGQGINVVYMKDNVPEKIVEIPASAEIMVDTPVISEPAVVGPTIRTVLTQFMQQNNYTLVEMTNDARKLDTPSTLPEISSFNDLHKASDGLIKSVYVDKERRQIRVK